VITYENAILTYHVLEGFLHNPDGLRILPVAAEENVEEGIDSAVEVYSMGMGQC
jgi:hypothetical protein